jgi:hypothetical protein
MMVGHDGRDEQDQQRWHARFAKERRGLSVSVNETLADPHLQEDFEDELHDEPESMPHTSQKLLIAPRLSLQSKQMPTVHIVPDKLVRPLHVDSSPETNHVEVPPVAPKKKRLAGRNTKVHLQAVPKSEKRIAKKMASSPDIIDSTIVEQAMPDIALSLPETRMNEHDTERPIAVSLKKNERFAREKLAGAGQILQGQAEITIENSLVSASSVVMVNLLGNPGPVVVQYYTMLPDYGFKVHLSAPVSVNTPFNYVILLGELF